MPENNKNQFSREEWGQRVRALRNGSSVSPPSVRRTPVNVSGSLGQLKANLDALNGQRLGLAAGNIAKQYNLADRLAQTTAELGANQIARREKLYANRQQNLNRMSQLYGNYYQQFGNVLNESALKFLDDHSNISVPTLTAIMAGYEHARASRAEQELAMLDRKSKMLEAQWAVQDKIVETQQQKDANDRLLDMQRIEAQSKGNQSIYEAQKAYLDEQARNEMLSVGLASTGRGTGVRALPGMGGVARGARGAAGRVPADVMGVRSGETVTRGAVPTGTVAQTPDGQTVAIDDNKNVMGIVTKDANGQSVVRNENGQTVGSVDANGNVIPITSEPQAGAYAQYQAAGGGGFWSDSVENTLGALTSPTAPLELIGAGYARKYLDQFGTSPRVGYLDPVRRGGWEGARLLASDANIQTAEASKNFIDAARQDPRYNARRIGGDIGRYEDYLQRRQTERVRRLTSGLPLRAYNTRPEELRAWNNLQLLRSAEANSAVANRNLANAVQSLGGQEVIDRASKAGRFMRGAGTVARIGARIGGRVLPIVGGAMLAADALAYGPKLLGGATGALVQGTSNLYDYLSGNRDRRIADAIATGQPIPQRPSVWETAGNYANEASAWFWNRLDEGFLPGRFVENFGMANRKDVNNFSRFFKDITGTNPDYHTRRTFDKLPDVSRATILNGMLTNRDLNTDNLQAFIDDTIRATTSPQEQEAIQQQIQAEDDQRVFEQSRAANGDNNLVKAVTEQLQGELARLGYNFDYEDVARFGIDYTDMVPWIETRNKVGAGNSQSSATSMYQITKPFFDNQRNYILKNFGHLLPPEQKDRLVKATNARDLDNDLDRPIIQAMVLANIYNNVSVNNQHFDKQGPNIQSVQMAGDIISMMKASSDAGQVDEEGYVDDPFVDGNLARLWATNFFRGTDPKAVRDAYNNVVNALNEKRGFNRDEQGNNLPWWDGSWMTPQRHREILGMSAPDTQQAAYGFDVAPGVDVDNLNTLLLQRFSAANDAMVSATGVKGQVNSGKRSTAKQTELYNNRANNPNPVGRPGWSLHQSGMALDFDNDRWEKAFNGNDQLKHDYGTFDNFLNRFGLQRGVTGKNGKRRDLVHLTMVQDDEYHNTIDHDRLMASRGKWGDQGGNHWMRGVGERPQQVQPAWDVGMQAMLNNFGYPQVVEYPGTEYDPDTIFAGNQDGYVFDYDYDEDGNLISY